jgi:ethanolamine ammonia-lyase large subunit
MYSATIGARRYNFRDLANLLAKASPLRSGDQLAGLSAGTDEERIAAQIALADLPLATFLHEQVVPYEVCEVTRLIVARNSVPVHRCNRRGEASAIERPRQI